MAIHTNQLISETSPYLLQHAHNPVDWMPYSQEVFRKAALEIKPILFSIGYSACHWCHVMEHESFEDEYVATLMNEHFICVKVDREERPDVDHLYMDAVQQITGRGGWPLNCFALPDGRPFWGGTYFRKEQWIEILTQISELFINNFIGLEEQAKLLTEGIAGTAQFISKDEDTTFTEKSLNEIIRALTENFDTINGGFTGAPKFPMPVVLELLLKLSATGKHESIRHHLQLTLEKIARGGIYDWVGGGFARYSVDTEWKVPHFEKMLYDNAQLISLYAKAYRLTKNNLFREVAEQSLEFVDRELTSPEGLFYCSLDAHSDGAEGKFYTWTRGEFNETVAPYGELLGEYFGIGREGLWEGEQNILLRPHDEDTFAQNHFLSVAELAALKAQARSQLFRQRETRVRPGLDDKILVSWNSLMIIALVNAYRAFGNKDYLGRAVKACETLIKKAKKEDGRIIHSLKKDFTKHETFLEDYAFLGQALLDVYGASFDERWLQECIGITGYALTHFREAGSNMFYFSEENELGLPRKIETYDGVIPSSNSAMAALLAMLGNLTENSDYENLSRQLLSKMASNAKEHPSSYSGWCSLVLDQLQPPLTIAIVGKKALPLSEKLNKNFLYTSFVTGTEKPSSLPYFVDRYVEGKTLIYICTENSCLAPVENADDAFELIKNYYHTRAK